MCKHCENTEVSETEVINKCCECNQVFLNSPKPINGNLYCADCFDKTFNVCSECGEHFSKDLLETIQGEKYCSDCKEKVFVTCKECNELVKLDNTHSNDGDYYYCQSCFDENYIICELCGEITHVDDSTEIRNSFYCDSCRNDEFTQCNDCDKWIKKDDSYYSNITDENYCESCYDDRFSHCESCDCEIESSEGEYCSECREEEENQLIKNYSFKPDPHFFKLKNETVFYGHEIEVVSKDGREQSAEKIQSLFDDMVYMKDDGSLPSDGFEIVTHPMSYEYTIKNSVFDKFKDINSIRSFKHQETGHHIHVSRTAIKSEFHLAKIIFFFSYNNDFIEFIAQRSLNSYCKSEKINGIINKIKNGNSDRYNAINLQNKNTIEFRIFKGNIAPERIIKNLQFCKAIIEYSEYFGLDKLTFESFINWIKDSEYSILYSFCKDYKLNINL